jgi:hypothetical protein
MVGLEARRERERLRQPVSPKLASVRRAVAHSGHHGLIGLSRYNQSVFGSNKHGDTYVKRLKDSMQRYRSNIRPNVYAIVMPAGHGKTFYAARYGLIDIDDMVTARVHNRLVDIRESAVLGASGWEHHNNLWIEKVNATLDLLDTSRPIVILLHHEEVAMEIGAQILAAFRLSRSSFEANIRDRDVTARHFSIGSYDNWVATITCPNNKDGLDNRELERLLLQTMSVNGLPVAAPDKYESNDHPLYSAICPQWLLRGDSPPDRDVDIAELADMEAEGLIPKECVDYYVRLGYTRTSMDFGVGIGDWVPVLADIAESINEEQTFDINGDFMEIFPPTEAKEANRANITMRRLEETFSVMSHGDVVDICKRHVGEPQVFICGLLTAWKGMLAETDVAHIVKPWFGVGYPHWSNIMKSVHTLIRTSRYLMNTRITESERQKLMYLDLLVGRASYVINELSELDKRGGDSYSSQHLSYDPGLGLFTGAQYKKDFSTAVRMAYSRMKYQSPPKIRVRSFTDWYRRRKTYLTKGSLVYNKLPSNYKRTVVSVFDSINETMLAIEARHNKQSLFEEMTLADLLKYIGDEAAFNTTKSMLKYEVGRKERTLLPGSLIHFIVFAYVLTLAEQMEQVGSVRLNAMPDEHIMYYDRKMISGLYHVLYDWADFNEQHSADEMSEVIEYLKEVVPAPPDYAFFVDAICQSMYNMHLEDKEGVLHKLMKGLYSGWRGTTWINTVLNFCYAAVALICYKRMYDEDPVLMIDHGGDDIDAIMDGYNSVPRFMAIMDNMLFNANVWKQMFSHRSEFFRNTITSSRAYASPTRALASFVAGDWEGSGNLTMRERVTNILDQTGKMARRGIPHAFANGLAIAALTHWCKLRVEDSWVAMPLEVIHGREEDGGLGVPDWFGTIWKLSKPVPDMQDRWLTVLKPSMLSSTDYVEELRKDVEAISLTLARKQELAEELAKDAYDADLRVDKLNWQEIVHYDGKRVGTITVVEERCDNSVFDDFVHFQITDDVIRKYATASRFTEMVSYLEVNGHPITRDQLAEIVGGGVPAEALDFGGNPYYRRLVPDFIGQKATYFCKELISRGILGRLVAQEVFETVCYMSREIFGHMM